MEDSKQPLLGGYSSTSLDASAPSSFGSNKVLNFPRGRGPPSQSMAPKMNEFHFDSVVGDIPLQQPNVQSERELADIINKKSTHTNECLKCVLTTGCCLTGIGCCYLWSKMVLIKDGEYGFSSNNGVPELLLPGRYVLASPVNHFDGKFDQGQDLIHAGPITVVRVPNGKLGVAINNTVPEVLVPGVHVRTSATFKFHGMHAIDQELIQFGPIKFFLVRSGGVRVCYQDGAVRIYKEGRYAVNSGTFEVGGTINTQQQNMRFEKHPVLLDGGISLLVEGLLTFQVEETERLIHQLGEVDLRHSLQDVTKAELARVFAGLHLEQISTATYQQDPAQPGFDLAGDLGEEDEKKESAPNTKLPESVLGTAQAQNKTAPHQSAEGQTRQWICEQVIQAVAPIASSWGVKIINFQLESTKIADDKYAKEYEAASLAMAKAKADLRAQSAKNQIQIQQAKAAAAAKKIQAQGEARAVVIAAQGEAEARTIEAKARNDAALSMTDPFSKQFALQQAQVDAIAALKATSLTVLPDSATGALLAGQTMFSKQQAQ